MHLSVVSDFTHFSSLFLFLKFLSKESLVHGDESGYHFFLMLRGKETLFFKNFFIFVLCIYHMFIYIHTHRPGCTVEAGEQLV